LQWTYRETPIGLSLFRKNFFDSNTWVGFVSDASATRQRIDRRQNPHDRLIASLGRYCNLDLAVLNGEDRVPRDALR
jgi:hypothetical protein